MLYYVQWFTNTHLMMAAKDIKKATDNFSCPVCYQLFRNPKYLTCHHSYCEQCLEKMQVQSKIICPECRKETMVPPGGMKDLDNNFFINRLVDEFILKRKVEGEEEVKCDECHGEDLVVVFCPDCTLFLCHVCNEHHKRSIKSRGHSIIPLTELRSKKDVAIQPKPKAMMCREHDIELLFYCETCGQLVCMYCTVKDHNGHNHDTVKKMVGKHREELKKITAPVEEMISGLSETHDNIEKMMKKIRKQGDEVSKKIDQHYDGAIQKLIQQKEQMKQQINDTVSQIMKAVTTQLEEVEYAQAEVLSMKELNDAVGKSFDQEALSVKKQVMIDRMQKITDKCRKVNRPPVQQATMEFEPTKQALPQLGFLYSLDPHKCQVVDISKYFIKGKKIELSIITKLNNGDGYFRGGSQVSVQLGEVNDAAHAQVRDNNDGSYMASFVPQKAGKMKLSVFVNGEQIKGSPYTVMVRDYASVNKPTKVYVENNYGHMGGPWGVAFGRNGIWAAADYTKDLVYIFNHKSRLIRKIGSNDSSTSQLDGPAGVAFDSDDYLYVVDHSNSMVKKFTTDGRFLLQFGGKGSQKGKLIDPRGIAIHNCKVYVADSTNKRISVFQTDGNFFCIIGSGQL